MDYARAHAYVSPAGPTKSTGSLNNKGRIWQTDLSKDGLGDSMLYGVWGRTGAQLALLGLLLTFLLPVS